MVDIPLRGQTVAGAIVFDLRRQRREVLTPDLVVNACGPWAGKLAAMVGLQLPVRPAPGVMLSLPTRLTQMVINRPHPAAEGDIVVPQRRLTLPGTTVWLAEDPDRIELPQDHIARILKLCGHLVPKIADSPVHAAWCASRPLIVQADEKAEPAHISRTFDCIDHAATDGIEGLISIVGGKATTMRAMAEAVADMVCAKTGRAVACRTHETKLIHYRHYYR